MIAERTAVKMTTSSWRIAVFLDEEEVDVVGDARHSRSGSIWIGIILFSLGLKALLIFWVHKILTKTPTQSISVTSLINPLYILHSSCVP